MSYTRVIRVSTAIVKAGGKLHHCDQSGFNTDGRGVKAGGKLHHCDQNGFNTDGRGVSYTTVTRVSKGQYQ